MSVIFLNRPMLLVWIFPYVSFLGTRSDLSTLELAFFYKSVKFHISFNNSSSLIYVVVCVMYIIYSIVYKYCIVYE